ncbi:MAG: cytidine deaminase [Muribaculaceae bacterium]|nr:cytidine deaminase [Muribaculaceae bacterium]
MIDNEIKLPCKIADYDDLTELQKQLVDKAKAATYRSYAPYSRFSVGAAIALDNGETVTGSNQENAAFPSGTCAERTAAYYAHSQFPDARFIAIAVAARGTSGDWLREPISPCGACRQALLEYETLAGSDVQVLLVGMKGIYILPSVKTLLPFAFEEIG